MSRNRNCTLVNPLCPDDLCVLPNGHPGTKEGKHLLGTFPGSFPQNNVAPSPKDAVVVSEYMWMAHRNTTDESLIHLGWETQERLIREGKLD